MPERPYDISVVVPVLNMDAPEVLMCQESLGRQKFEGSFEALVVEGGTIAQARNEGIRRSRGGLIAFIDSDCVATENWLSRLVGVMGGLPDAGGVGGESLPRRGSGGFQGAVGYVYGSYLGSLGSASLARVKAMKTVRALSTSNCIYTYEAITGAGGFDERYLMNEDTELGRRVRELGYKLYFTPDVEVYHKMEGSNWEVGEKFIKWGVSRTRSTLTNFAHFDAKVAFLLSLFLFSFSLIVSQPHIFSVLAACYLLTLLAHGIHCSLIDGDPVMGFIVPLVYITQHLSYGVGLIIGVLLGPYREQKPYSGFRVLHVNYPTDRSDESPI